MNNTCYCGELGVFFEDSEVDDFDQCPWCEGGVYDPGHMCQHEGHWVAITPSIRPPRYPYPSHAISEDTSLRQ